MKQILKRVVLVSLCLMLALPQLALAQSGESEIIDKYIEQRQAEIRPSPDPMPTPKPTVSPRPTATVKATATASATQKPTAAPAPKATVSPRPAATATAAATLTPGTTAAAQPTAAATATPKPTATPEPTPTAAPSASPTPANEGKIRTLHKDSYGNDVEALQDALTELGFFTSRVDGQFGPRTERALKKYQKARGLKVDGVLGAETRRTLAEDGYEMPAWYPEVYPEGFERTLKKGMKGMDVRAVQEKLIEKGYLTGRADHIYGNKTRSAVKKFQQDNNLRVTGICNGKTLFLLMD